MTGEETEGKVFVQGHTASKYQASHVEQNLFWLVALWRVFRLYLSGLETVVFMVKGTCFQL